MIKSITDKVAKIPILDKERLESLTTKEKVILVSKLAECGGSASWNSLVRVIDKSPRTQQNSPHNEMISQGCRSLSPNRGDSQARKGPQNKLNSFRTRD